MNYQGFCCCFCFVFFLLHFEDSNSLNHGVQKSERTHNCLLLESLGYSSQVKSIIPFGSRSENSSCSLRLFCFLCWVSVLIYYLPRLGKDNWLPFSGQSYHCTKQNGLITTGENWNEVYWKLSVPIFMANEVLGHKIYTGIRHSEDTLGLLIHKIIIHV